MSAADRHIVSSATRLYVAGVVICGLSVIAAAIAQFVASPPPTDLLFLAILTLVSGVLPVKLPKVAARISVSETFVSFGTVLFGPFSGAMLGFLDVALMWARLGNRKVKWHRMLFSLSANPLAIWLSGNLLFKIAQTEPLFGTPEGPPGLDLILGLAAFGFSYYLINSWMVAAAIALDQGLNAIEVWKQHFSNLWLNHWAGASVTALLVSYTHGISAVAIFVIAPLMLVLFFTYSWSIERVEKAEKHLDEMKRTFMQTIEALALAIDAKDQVTHGHIRRVQRYTMALAEALGMSDEKQVDALRAAALLHDTGKLAVPEYILNKPGPLTSSEFERMKLHAAVGADILKSIDFPYPVEPIVRYHHEAWDGSGYPEGLRGTEIPLGARILSVVDCYDALTSDRPYRPRMTRQQAEQILMERRGKSYDPWVVDQFRLILDKLERDEAAHRMGLNPEFRDAADATPEQYDVISATTAEDREFNELRRDLPRTSTLAEASNVLFRHLKRIIPAAGLALYRPRADSTEVQVVASFGVAAIALEDLRVPIGDRVSGWIYSSAQPVLNADASLELGPVARTYSPPLRFATGVPLLDSGEPVGIVLALTTDPLEQDQRRLLENAATLFTTSVARHVLKPKTDLRDREAKPAVRQKNHVH